MSSIIVRTLTRNPDFFDLHRGRPTDRADQRFWQELSSITKDTSIEVVRKLIAQTPGFSWGSRLSNWNKCTLLHIAAEQNNLRLIYEIVKKGGPALLEVGEEHLDATPMMCAAVADKYEAVKLLCALGGNVNVFGSSDLGRTSILEAALSNGMELDPITGTYIENPRAGYQLYKLLISRGARLQKDSLVANKAEIFSKEFSMEIAAASEKCVEISMVFKQIFPGVSGEFVSELQKIVVKYAFGPDDEGLAYDCIRVEMLTEKRIRCIKESPITERAMAFFLEFFITQRKVHRTDPTLKEFLVRIINVIVAYDEGESYKEAHWIQDYDIICTIREQVTHNVIALPFKEDHNKSKKRNYSQIEIQSILQSPNVTRSLKSQKKCDSCAVM